MVVENSESIWKFWPVNMKHLMKNIVTHLTMLEVADALGDAIGEMEESLKKRWWWKILWPILVYSPLIFVIIYILQM